MGALWVETLRPGFCFAPVYPLHFPDKLSDYLPYQGERALPKAGYGLSLHHRHESDSGYGKDPQGVFLV